MTTAAKFLALSPVVGTRYDGACLAAYGWLRVDGDCHGTVLWTDGTEVFSDEGITYENTYYGERTPAECLS
jgi:hypothetical protein